MKFVGETSSRTSNAWSVGCIIAAIFSGGTPFIFTDEPVHNMDHISPFTSVAMCISCYPKTHLWTEILRLPEYSMLKDGATESACNNASQGDSLHLWQKITESMFPSIPDVDPDLLEILSSLLVVDFDFRTPLTITRLHRWFSSVKDSSPKDSHVLAESNVKCSTDSTRQSDAAADSLSQKMAPSDWDDTF